MSLIKKIYQSIEKNQAQIAIQDGKTSYTYKELKTSVLGLSSLLNQKKLERVAIMGTPSFMTAVSMLSALISRSLYIPLDPAWPSQRIRAILQDSQAQALLIPSKDFKNLGDKKALNIPLLEIQASSPALIVKEHLKGQLLETHKLESSLDFPQDFKKDNSLAYIMYTSASSGRAKGVEVFLQALEKFLDWVEQKFQISSQDRLAYISSLGFGASIRQIFSPVLSGAKMICLPQELLKVPQELLKEIQDKKITIFNAPPVLLQQLAQQAQKQSSDLSKLRLVLAGGDLFPKKIAQLWFEQFSHKHQLVNLYGSTESIVNASSYVLSPDFLASSNSLTSKSTDTIEKIKILKKQEYLPIGQARPGLKFFLLDENQQKIKAYNKVGELCIQSAYVARSYHNNTEESQKTFIIDNKEAQNNIYNTGDRALQLETGDYLLLGRADKQVQIYGQRLELGEIESHLNQHKEIQRAFALYIEDSPWKKVIVFIKSKNIKNQNFDEKVFRNFLKKQLPSYMIPHEFLSIDKIPISHSGKVDYKVLEKKARSYLQEKNIKPKINKPQQKDLEIKIKQIWQKYLGSKEFSYQDSFFDLGGDSIMAVSVYQDLSQSFDVFLDPYIFYQSPTVEKLALALKQAYQKKALKNTEEISNQTQKPAKKTPQSLKLRLLSLLFKAIRTTDKIKAFFYRKPSLKTGALSPQQKHFVWTKKIFNELYNGCFSVPINNSFDKEKFKQALELVVKHQESLRTIFVANQQRVLPEFPPDLRIYDLKSYSKSQQEEFILEQEQKLLKYPFQLSKLPLFKLQLLELSDSQSHLIFNINHVIGDGWSLQAFLSFLNDCYAFLDHKKDSLTKLSYLDYTKQYKAFCRKVFPENQAYWDKKLSNYKSYNVSSKFETHSLSEESLILGEKTKTQIDDFCRQKKISAFDFLLFVWSKALQEFLNCKKVCFFITYHGRDFPLKNIQNPYWFSSSFCSSFYR